MNEYWSVRLQEMSDEKREEIYEKANSLLIAWIEGKGGEVRYPTEHSENMRISKTGIPVRLFRVPPGSKNFEKNLGYTLEDLIRTIRFYERYKPETSKLIFEWTMPPVEFSSPGEKYLPTVFGGLFYYEEV